MGTSRHIRMMGLISKQYDNLFNVVSLAIRRIDLPTDLKATFLQALIENKEMEKRSETVVRSSKKKRQ